MKMLLVGIFTLSCAQISNATTPPVYRWFPPEYTTPPHPTGDFVIMGNRACTDYSGYSPGVYFIQPNRDTVPFKVYCDVVDGRTWTVIQQRFDKSVDFYTTYRHYTKGFGPIDGTHWLGLEKLHQMTKNGDHELLVVLQAFNLTSGYARYSTFIVGSEATGFKLTISGYSGTAGDSMTRGENLNGMKFSTVDKDQDNYEGNCGQFNSAGWWFNNCAYSEVNSPYHDKPVRGEIGMRWYYNFGSYSLKSVRMFVRRKYPS